MGLIGWHLDTGSTDEQRQKLHARKQISFAGSQYAFHFRLVLLAGRFGGLRIAKALAKRQHRNRTQIHGAFRNGGR
jgi:hypothetical protein